MASQRYKSEGPYSIPQVQAHSLQAIQLAKMTILPGPFNWKTAKQALAPHVRWEAAVSSSLSVADLSKPSPATTLQVPQHIRSREEKHHLSGHSFVN